MGSWWRDPWTLPALVALVLSVGLLAGTYPALVLSRFGAVQALRGGVRGQGRARVRQALVLTQFALSVVLLVGVIVMWRQLDFMQTARLGLEPEQIVQIPLTPAVAGRYSVIATELRSRPDVERVTAGDVVGGSSIILFDEEVPEKPENGVLLAFHVDRGYVPTLGMEIADGRDFAESTDAELGRSVILNEAAVRSFGWDRAVGRRFQSSTGSDKTYVVVGVVKDWHFRSMKEVIDPAALVLSDRSLQQILVKIRTTDVPATVAGLGEVWSRFEPERPFTYRFLDDEYDALYRSERRAGTLFSISAALAILVSCLGLFGLASLAAEQRTHEVGLRKVLGASVSGIVGLLSRDVLKPVALACLVATPIAWLVSSRFLQSFAYHVSLGPGTFALAFAVTAIVAWATVGSQAIRAATADPVDSLRHE